MKKTQSILLVLVLFSGLFRDSVTILMFKLNQEYIAENLCVNRDKPMTMCGGSCYLKNRLEDHHRDEEENPASRTKEDRPLEFCADKVFSVRPVFPNIQRHRFTIYSHWHLSDIFESGVFHPPKA